MSSPIYIQIHNQIKQAIEAGRWAVGDRIPSERELATQFDVSRMTLRQAIQTLVDEGILERRVGAGTFVANQKVQEKMSGVTSFTDDVPICFEVATVPERLVKQFTKDEITSSLYRTLEEKASLVPGKAQQTVSAMSASERIAEYLSVRRGDALLRLRQISYLQTGEPFEYVRTQYVGNRFEFYLEK